jgi:hypothetical protein
MDEHVNREIVTWTIGKEDVQGFARAVAVGDIGQHRQLPTRSCAGCDDVFDDSVEIRDMAADSKGVGFQYHASRIRNS